MKYKTYTQLYIYMLGAPRVVHHELIELGAQNIALTEYYYTNYMHLTPTHEIYLQTLILTIIDHKIFNNILIKIFLTSFFLNLFW